MAGTGSGADLVELGERYFRAKSEYDPFNATLLGLTEFDGLTGSPSGETSAEAERTFAGLRAQVEALDPVQLEEDQQVDRQVLGALLRGAETDARHSLWAATVSGAGYVSRQGTLFQALAATEVTGSESGQRYLARLAALPAYFGELGQRYREELAAGRLPTRVGVHHAIGQLRSETTAATLLRPVEGPGAGEWRARAEELAAAVVPALGELADLLETELLPAGRGDDRVGIRWIPDGDQAYADALFQNTTTERSAEEIHQLGMDMLAELEERWATVGQQACGLTDRVAISERLRNDPALRFETREQIVEVIRGAMERAEEALPRYFPTDVPIGPCDVLELDAAESENSALAYYRPPADDGSRNGAQCIATSDPTTRYRYEYEALSFHESVPGHHLQLATSQLLELPRYRRHLDAEVCGFNEGWGLYTEDLADELGLYSDDFSRLGMLSFQALRACRLVVDTGMHALGWSRDRAITFMWDHTATTREHIEQEVDRYINWPGQACAYAVGKREILLMRARAEQALGAGFDLPSFHWALIRNGAIPLSVASSQVSRWQESVAG
jgi:uncharacterized protein (DUF885 family)